ncbi:MAG: hypothetical protein K0R28_746 [Paenibacillus sp.]|nr:hypothetical protein [Paenibacillus sp.]
MCDVTEQRKKPVERNEGSFLQAAIDWNFSSSTTA